MYFQHGQERDISQSILLLIKTNLEHDRFVTQHEISFLIVFNSYTQQCPSTTSGPTRVDNISEQRHVCVFVPSRSCMYAARATSRGMCVCMYIMCVFPVEGHVLY
jgi:hypothetical protein